MPEQVVVGGCEAGQVQTAGQVVEEGALLCACQGVRGQSVKGCGEGEGLRVGDQFPAGQGWGGRARGDVGVGGDELVQAHPPALVQVLMVVVPACRDRRCPAQGDRCRRVPRAEVGLGEFGDSSDVEGRGVPGVARGLLVAGADHDPGQVWRRVDPRGGCRVRAAADGAGGARRQRCEWAVGWQRVGVSGLVVWMSW